MCLLKHMPVLQMLNAKGFQDIRKSYIKVDITSQILGGHGERLRVCVRVCLSVRERKRERKSIVYGGNSRRLCAGLVAHCHSVPVPMMQKMKALQYLQRPSSVARLTARAYEQASEREKERERQTHSIPEPIPQKYNNFLEFFGSGWPSRDTSCCPCSTSCVVSGNQSCPVAMARRAYLIGQTISTVYGFWLGFAHDRVKFVN